MKCGEFLWRPEASGLIPIICSLPSLSPFLPLSPTLYTQAPCFAHVPHRLHTDYRFDNSRTLETLPRFNTSGASKRSLKAPLFCFCFTLLFSIGPSFRADTMLLTSVCSERHINGNYEISLVIFFS